MLVEFREGVDYCQAGAGGALAVIIVGLGPAEVGHDPIAEVLGDMSTKSSDRLGRGAMVSSHHLTPFFGVELSSDLGRAHEIAEKHRQMAPLAR